MLDKDIADLMGIVPTDFAEPVIRGGAFDDVKDTISPFGYEKCEGRLGGNYASGKWDRMSHTCCATSPHYRRFDREQEGGGGWVSLSAAEIDLHSDILIERRIFIECMISDYKITSSLLFASAESFILCNAHVWPRNIFCPSR